MRLAAVVTYNDGSSAEDSCVGMQCVITLRPHFIESCYDNNSARMATSMTTAGILLPDWL